MNINFKKIYENFDITLNNFKSKTLGGVKPYIKGVTKINIKPNTVNIKPNTVNIKPNTVNIKPNPSNIEPKPSNIKPYPHNINPNSEKIKQLNKTKESDFIKSSDPPQVQQQKRTLLNQATDFISQNPGLALGAVGLAAYMFSSGQSLPGAIASLGQSAGSTIGSAIGGVGNSIGSAIGGVGSAIGSAIGGVGSGIMNTVNSSISGITGIPKEDVKYIWWALLVLFIFYLLLKIKTFFFGD